MKNSAQSAAEYVYASLRRDIIEGCRLPDDVLSRPLLAKELKVSPTPVREALLRLERENLVHVFRQSKTVVSRISVSALHRAQVLRVALDCEVVSRLARRKEPVLLERAHQVAGAGFKTGDNWASDEAAFFRALYDAAGVGELLDDVGDMMSALERLRVLMPASPDDLRRAQGFCRDLVGRIEASDEKGAVSVARAFRAGDLSTLGKLRSERAELFCD